MTAATAAGLSPLRVSALALACTLVCAAIGLSISEGKQEARNVIAVLLTATAATIVVLCFRALQAWTLRHDLFSPLFAFPVAYILWFTLGSIDWIEVPSIFSFGLFDPIPGIMWLYYALGLAGFLLGAVLGKNRTIVCRPAVAWDPRRSRRVVVALAVVLLISWLALVAQFGIPGLRSTASELRLRIRGPFYLLFVISAWTAFVLVPLRHWFNGAARSSALRMTVFVLAVAVLLASSAGRSNIFVPLLTLLITRHYGFSRFDLRRLAVLALAVFIGLSIFGYARDIAESEASLDWLQIIGIPAPLVPITYSGIYVRYAVATFRDVTLMIPTHAPYQMGALSFAPFRTFFPGHQEMSDVFFKNLLGSDFVGVGQPATLLGPLYADFGAPGIFLGMFAYGALLRFCYRRMAEQLTPLRVLTYAWVLQSGLFGLFANLFPYITTLLLPLLWLALDRFMIARPKPALSE